MGLEQPTRRGLSPAAGCLLALAIGLAGAALCLVLGILVVQGEVRLPGGELTAPRLWLVREPQAQGLGLETKRIVRGGVREDAACVETRVRFLLWRSDGSASRLVFCECYGRVDERWELKGPCAPSGPDG